MFSARREGRKGSCVRDERDEGEEERNRVGNVSRGGREGM
jgi:hypothetical protein